MMNPYTVYTVYTLWQSNISNGTSIMNVDVLLIGLVYNSVFFFSTKHTSAKSVPAKTHHSVFVQNICASKKGALMIRWFGDSLRFRGCQLNTHQGHLKSPKKRPGNPRKRKHAFFFWWMSPPGTKKTSHQKQVDESIISWFFVFFVMFLVRSLPKKVRIQWVISYITLIYT